MLLRIFTPILIILFLIATHDQSHSAELTSQSHIHEFSSKELSIQHRKRHCQDQKIEKEAVSEKSSRFIIDREYLKRSKIDVPDANDPSSQVVSKISLNSSEIEEKKILDFVNALAQSQIINLSLRRNLPPELAEVLVALLQGGVRFQISDIWGLQWQRFNTNDNSKYHRVKRIGASAKNTIEKEFKHDFPDKKVKEENTIREEKIKKQQETFDKKVLNGVVYGGLFFISIITVYSPILSVFTCTMLMIIIAIPLG